MWFHVAFAEVNISDLVANKHSLSSSTVAAIHEQIMCVCCNSGLELKDVHGMLCQALLVFHVVVCCATLYTKAGNFFHV
jgi:hypothetical protein